MSNSQESHMLPYQRYIHMSRYARFRDDLGRRENWEETVDRYVSFFEKREGSKLPQSLWAELRSAIGGMKVMPSMRAMMSAGPALEKENLCGFNCSYLSISRVRSLAEMLYILMCGTGVGFSVERQLIKKLPEVAEGLPAIDKTPYVVEDSKEGWAEAYEHLLTSLWEENIIPTFDYSLVRPAGERLMTMGGRASGPGPLKDLFQFTTQTFMNARGRRLHSTELHDLACKVGEIVVVGGVRRSALISLSNLSDDRMRDAKSGNWYITHPWRSMANNSAAYTEKPDCFVFTKEWLALMNSGSGERGIFNREVAQRRVKNLPTGRDHDHEFGTNPCVTGDTRILTPKGYVQISEVSGSEVEVWNGYNWSKSPVFSTGVNPILEIEFSDGTLLKTTPYHRFALNGTHLLGETQVHDFGRKTKSNYRSLVEARFLKIGDKLAKFNLPVVLEGEEYSTDAYSQGFYAGDGCSDHTLSYVYSPKYSVIPRLVGEIRPALEGYSRRDWKHGPMLSKRFVPLHGSLNYRLNWLAGLLDSDGCVVRDKNSEGLQIVSTDEEFLKETKLLLTTLGCASKVRSQGSHGNKFFSKEGRAYINKPTFILIIGSVETFKLQELGLKCSRLKLNNLEPQRSALQFVQVTRITNLGEEETFCFTEPEVGLGTFEGMVTGNCGEIILRDMGLCNLTEVILRPTDTYEQMVEKVRYATILGTLQSTLTKFKFVDSTWEKNAIEERLLGVSLTGILDLDVFRIQSFSTKAEARQILRQLRKVAHETNKEFAELLGIEPSKAITCVKPSGTVSLLTNCSPGIHPGYGNQIIRRIRNDMKDPMTQFLIEQGVPWEPCVNKPEEVAVFSFYIESSDYTLEDLTAIHHCEIIKMFAEEWCDHNPSSTVIVRDNEWLEVGAWVYKNFDSILGTSFLPYFGSSTYQQLPIEPVSRAVWEEGVANSPNDLDWYRLAEIENGVDNVERTRELACVSGTCEIPN